MWNASRYPLEDSTAALQSSSRMLQTSSAGRPTTPADSSIPCSTNSSAGMQKTSGPSSPAILEPGACPIAPACGAGELTDISEVAAQVAFASDQAELLHLLRTGCASLGVERAAFVSLDDGKSDDSPFRVMLHCPAWWCHQYLERGGPRVDAWARYAIRESEPVFASALNIVDPAQRALADLATEAGFVSTLLIPAHSGTQQSRVSLLCLGHSMSGYFEAPGIRGLRVHARALAMELHDWWVAHIRRETVDRIHITGDEQLLLEHCVLGHTSARIGKELCISRAAVNSRFQRLHAKLGVKNRRTAARIAVECGLVAW